MFEKTLEKRKQTTKKAEEKPKTTKNKKQEDEKIENKEQNNEKPKRKRVKKPTKIKNDSTDNKILSAFSRFR